MRNYLYHLYYKLPEKNSPFGQKHELRYQILRSDTYKIVCYAATKKEAEKIVDHFNEHGELLSSSFSP